MNDPLHIADALPGASRTGPALRVIALDLALAATGIAATHDHDGKPQLNLRTAKPRTDGHARLHDHTVEVAAAARCWPQIAVIEGYSYGSYYGGAHGPGMDTLCELAELHGIVRQWLWYQGIPYALVAPKTRAVYATGNGNAGKRDVLTQARLRYGHLFADGVATVRDDDQGDALILLAMACDHYGSPLVEVPKTHRRALESVEWPEIPLPGSAAATAAARRGSGVMVP